MNQKLRIILFGTLLLSAFLLSASLSSQVFAASTTANVNGATPSLAKPLPNGPSYAQGFALGYQAGYKSGLTACATHHSWFQPQVFKRPGPFSQGYAAGYAKGFQKGAHSCSNYMHNYPASNNHPGEPFRRP